MLARKCRQRRADRNGTASWASWVRLLVRPLNIAERVPTENGTDRLRVGIGIEDQVRLRLGLAVLSLERLVQEMIKDLAVELGLFPIVVQKSSERIGGAGRSWEVGT